MVDWCQCQSALSAMVTPQHLDAVVLVFDSWASVVPLVLVPLFLALLSLAPLVRAPLTHKFLSLAPMKSV